MKWSLWKYKTVLLVAVLTASGWLLGEDAGSFIRWWTAVFCLGFACFPLAASLCDGFCDKGWLVSKVLGIAGGGFLVWLLVNIGLLKFTALTCGCLSASVALAVWLVCVLRARRGKKSRIEVTMKNLEHILDGELIFTVAFLLWTYMAGFRPAAYGTEKFMDYGFMMAMMRSDTLPAADLWFAGSKINYYYGGQYFAVYLTKLTLTQVEETYHLMRTLVAGFAFSLPFTLVRQMLLDYNRKGRVHARAAVFGGLLAGAGVSLAGNMHYVIIGKLLPLIRQALGLEESDYTYWFPNSTRYIGYYPEGNDKTIHEFPCYSFVLGDLHAHVVNLMFVLALILLIYALVQRARRTAEEALRLRGEMANTEGEAVRPARKIRLRNVFLDPYILLFGFFIGLFHWTNYWDFVIYFVMGGMGVIYANYLRCAGCASLRERVCRTAEISVLHAVWVLALGALFALPFTLQFETMVNGVALAQNHSRPYQWWIIWGLQVCFTALFMASMFWDYRKKKKMWYHSDVFGMILGISALGLIVIPEIVYVRDIYEAEYARSNTMFKLTYQAFLMFGMLMGYGFVRLWIRRKRYLRKALTGVAFACFVGCLGYFGTAVESWFGDVLDRSGYQGLDATQFLETDFADDAAAIRWLNENVEGNPVVLEANGDSYTGYERVSAMTGLPTVLGWYVHEWLWRGDIAELNQRSADVQTIYTSTDSEAVTALLEEYDVSYIFVGSKEREKYADLNGEMLCSLGDVVYLDSQTGTYIIKCDVTGSVTAD